MRALSDFTVQTQKRRQMFDKAFLARQRFKRRALVFAVYGFLVLVSLPIIVGYTWLLLSSFSKGFVYGIVPQTLTLDNWRFLWERPAPYYPELWSITWNTFLLAIGMTITMVIVSTPTAYAISRLKFPGRQSFLALTLVLHAFPGITLLIAVYYVLGYLGLLNSVTGVFLVKAALFMPLGIWVMKGFFDGIPWDVEMSALVDGASRFQAMYKIMIPQVMPGIAAISIFSFIYGWAEYIFVVTFIQDKSRWTLASYVNSVIGDFLMLDYGLLAATAAFYVIPVMLFFLFTQKHLMRVTVGGIKGGR
jgi:inositol-phosphate transport system permease protein